MRISYVHSLDGNSFELISPLLTGHQPGHFWLKGLEKALQVSISLTIHRILQSINLDYLINPDNNQLTVLVSSLRDNPLQCVAMALCLTWTYVIDKSIDEDNPNLLYMLGERLSQCTSILIKDISSPLEANKRSAASRLIIYIQNLQYSLSSLQKESSMSCDNFLWASNFKCRYSLSDSESDELTPILAISHLNYNYPYCSEYQGAGQELVLTPITEKCVFNLSLAMYTNKLAGVIGLNGSAISETVKALCYITGRACFSLDASSFQTHAQVTNALLGFIESGTIGYIANLDRLKANLSCTLVTLLQAVKGQIENSLPYKCFLYFYDISPKHDSNIDWYNVNEFGILGELSIGRKVFLKHGYGCCVSMSNQNLPEEFSNYLHTQIHFFYFSKPSYKQMLEAHLLSHDFSSYKVLSCKVMSFINHLKKLFKKELVAQPTDFRRVLREAIIYLESAGKILGQESSMEEREILSVYYAIWRVVKPQLAKSELIMAKSVLNSIFPECSRCIGILSQLDFDDKETADLEKILTRILVERQYRANAKEMEKIFDIYNSLQHGQNVVIFGPTLCGKTTCLQLLANALNEKNDKLVDLTTIYPHALDTASMYGWYDNESQIWRQGLLQKLLSNKLSSDPQEFLKSEQWFVFDGCMQGDWIAQLHSMLSLPKQFTTCDATTIQLPDTCKFIFETDTLCNVAPSLLSHCYPIPMGEGVLTWRDQLDQWLKSITVSQGIAKSDVIDLRRYTDNTVAAILEYLRDNVAENIQPNQSLEMLYVRRFTNIMSAMLKKFYFLTYKSLTSTLVLSTITEEETNYKVLDLIFVFSLAWGFGGSLDADRKIAFSEFLSKLFQQTGITSGLSDRQDQNIFNYYIEPTKRMFVSWSDRTTDYASFGSYVQISEIDKLSVIGELLLNNDIPVFYSGPVGCGKTSMIENLLQHRVKLSSLSYSPLWTPSRLQQRIRATHLVHQKSHVAVPHLEERCTLFIDDFNIPSTQIGCPDVLRQVIESRLVYDTSVNVMKPVSIQLIVCSNYVYSLSNSSRVQHDRLYSHFFNLTMDDPDSATLFKIFSPPVFKWLSGHYPPSQEANRANYITQILVKTSVVVYECIRDKLKPTPATPQYSFSLFELNRLFQSLFVFTPKHKDKAGSKADTDKQRNKRTSVISRKRRQRHLSRYDTIQSGNYAIEMEDNFEYFVSLQRNLVRLWCHEHCRVYGDTISGEKDQEWFQMLLKNCVQRAFCSISEMRSASEDNKSLKKISKPMRFALKKQPPIEENRIIARHTEEMSKENFWRVKIPLNKIFAVIEEMTSLMYFRMPQTSIPESPSSINSRSTPLSKYLYSEVTDLAFKNLLQPHLDSLNENLTAENKIIIYPSALEQIVRLSRLLQMFEGHALFCAQRSTGRKTIAKLAAALTKSHLYDMQANTERNSFKDCLPILQAAINSSVISRAHSVVVVTGDWLPEVWHAIGELLALENVNQERIIKELEEGSPFQHYRVSPIPEIFKTDIAPPHYPPPLIRNLLKHNLHFVVIINHIPNSFTHFFTQYHKLVRYLTLNIVSPLCEFSLREVAHTWLSKNAVNKWVDEETSLDTISEVAAHIHCTAFEKAQIIYPKYDLWIYKSNIKMFIDFLKTSSKMAYVIFRKESRLTREVRKAQDNLTEARLEVETMRVEMKQLEERRRDKIQNIREFEEEIDLIRMEYRNAELVNKQHVEEIQKCNEMIEMLRKDLKFQFGEVDPLYKRAGEALIELCQEDIVELTTFQKPPDGVKRLAECLCVLFKRELSWGSAQELFRTKHFYQNLLYYDKGKNMTTILSSPQIRLLCSDAEMNKIAFSSKAAASVARWLIALYRHATVDEETRGKRHVLTELEEEVERLEIQRGKERVKMINNNSQLENNNTLLETKRSEIIQFDKEIQVYRDSIRDAYKIFSSLQLSEAKFNKIIVESHNRVTSIGNVLITSGAINYLTPFPSNVILELVNVWKEICGIMPPNGQIVSTASVKVTPDFSLQEILTTEEERFYWEIKKRELPQGEDYRLKLILIRAVASFDCLWPYVYDPTGLFYKWIKSMESTFRGEEIEHLFELTKNYEEAIKVSASLPAIYTQPKKLRFSDRKRSISPPPFGSKSIDTASSTSTPPPESSEKILRLRKSWSQIQRRSIVKAIFSTNLHLVRCYDDEFENILEEEIYRISPVPVIALSMSCLPPRTSRKVIYSEFEERDGRRYHKLEGKEVEVRASFRLYMTSNYSPMLRAADVTNIDMNKVRFCSFEPARESLRDILFMILADVEMREVQNKLDTATRDVIHFYKLMKEKRKKLLKHIIDSPSIASDLDLVKLISSTGRELERAEEGRMEYQETCDKLQDQLDILRVVSDNLEIVWYALDRMQNMCKRKYNFTLAGFLEITHVIASRTVTETFRPNDCSVEGRVHYISGVMLRETCSFYLSQMIESDKAFFLLTLIFSTRISHGHLSQLEWDTFFSPTFSIANCTELLNSLFSEFSSNTPSFISPEVWGHISQQKLPSNFASVIEALSSQPTEWEEYFKYCLHGLMDGLPSSKRLDPENRLLLWRETHPKDFLKLLGELLVHRMGNVLERLSTFSFSDAFLLSTSFRPLLVYTDSRECVGDCLEFVRFQMKCRGEEYLVFDLACKSSLASLELAMGLEGEEKKEWLIILNCENISCWPQTIIRFLNVSFLCRFGDESKNKAKRIVVITRSSALNNLPLSLKSSSLKLAYNHRYFTPGERLEIYTNVLRDNLGTDLDTCILLMKINAEINSGIKYGITENINSLTGHIGFLHSVVTYLQEFFSSFWSVAESDHFITSIFSGTYSHRLGRGEMIQEKPVFNRLLPGILTGEMSKISLLEREIASSQVSLELVEQIWANRQERREEGELDLEPLLEMLDILIADVTTLLNIDISLYKSLLHSLQTGAQQAVYKQELLCIEQTLQGYLDLLKRARNSPYHSLQPDNLQSLQLLSAGYMPDLYQQQRTTISTSLVWYKETLGYYKSQIEGPCPVKLRYHQHPEAWLAASISEQAKTAGDQLERCIPVAKISTEEVEREEGLLGVLYNVSFAGVIFHQQSQSFSFCSSHSLSDQKVVLRCLSVEDDDVTYQPASLYCLGITHNPVYSCELYLPLTRKSERGHRTSNKPTLLIQLH
ncbi:hypothetical protein LOD99_541 [Oopsacas minuta]|uniref:Uncharacterized protein n=1 Tax=Oopsacas minuta TaxID=111878 RepID=A0AAV7K9G9_9METZ|nr:hypothetical protein LOD99_541 [Oopsacas minuta]